MEIQRATLSNCHEARGLVVVIDVIRAFSTAAYAFSCGVREILLASSLDQAFELRQRFPDYLIMGELSGLPVPGFDLSNSPTQLLLANERIPLRGRGMIQRTSAGTQGIVRSQQAEIILAASMLVAGATANAIKKLAPPSLTFVITGTDAGNEYKGPTRESPTFGDEDAACADYIEELLNNHQPDLSVFIQRILDSAPGRIFADPNRPEFPAADLPLCTAVDRFNFALRVEHRDDLLVMTSMNPND